MSHDVKRSGFTRFGAARFSRGGGAMSAKTFGAL
jgi:hypothetical protein